MNKKNGKIRRSRQKRGESQLSERGGIGELQVSRRGAKGEWKVSQRSVTGEPDGIQMWPRNEPVVRQR